MADIPLISTTPGSATDAPDAANLTINPAVVSLNTLNDTTIPALQANAVSTAAAVSVLQGQVGVGQKISAMTPGGGLQALDLIPIERGGNNYSILGSVIGVGSQQLALSTFPGIDPTGVTDSRAPFISALASAIANNLYLNIDCPVRLTVGADYTKPIFLRSGLSMGCSGAGVLIADNALIPEFVLSNSTDQYFYNLKVQYVGQLPLNITTPPYNTNYANFNDITMKNDLIANFGNTFSGSGSCLFVGGQTNPSATFRIQGACQRIRFYNLRIFTAQGTTAPFFNGVCVSVDPQWTQNTLVTNNNQAQTASNTVMPQDIDFYNPNFDGFYMGFVGQGGFRVIDGKFWRYSDLQDGSGNNQGGVGTWFAPPHAIYMIDPDPSFNTQPIVKEVSGCYDYGQYVGGATRGGSRFLESYKITPTFNTKISNCKSLRAEGGFSFKTVGANSFGTINNIDCVFDSSTAFSDSAICQGVLFPSALPYQFLVIKGMTVRDKNPAPAGFPIGDLPLVDNNNCKFSDVEVYLNDFVATSYPGFGMSGNNMRLTADYFFNQYSTDQTSRGSFCMTGSEVLTNSRADITVHGYRLFPVTFSTPPTGTSTTLAGNWNHSSGTYLLQFNDNQVRYAVLTSGANTCTWAASGQGALVGTATLTASGTGTVATVTFVINSAAPLVGTQITIAGMTPAGYNGTYTVTASAFGSVSYANTTTGPQTVAGTIANFVNATAQNVLAANYAGYKQRMLSMQGGKGIGNRINIMDVTNGLESLCENGVVTETLTLPWSGTPPAGLSFALPIAIPATHNPDRASVTILTALGTSGGLTSFALGWAATPAALLTTIAPGVSPVTPLAAPVVTNAGTLRTLLLTATGGTGFDGTGFLLVTVRCVTVVGAA